MRHTIIGLALGLMLPLGVAHADIASDLKSGVAMETVITNALKSNLSLDAALQQIFASDPTQAYAAITAATKINADQAANIVSTSLSRQYNLNPRKVVSAALQGAPERAATIVSTAIVKSPSFHTTGIVDEALDQNVEGKKFVPPAMRISPRQADSILRQALRKAPSQAGAILEAAIADQPDKALDYTKLALDAGVKPEVALSAAFKAAPKKADQLAAMAEERGIPTSVIAAAAASAGVKLAGYDGKTGGSDTTAKQSGLSLSFGTGTGSGGSGGGGGCNPLIASCN